MEYKGRRISSTAIDTYLAFSGLDKYRELPQEDREKLAREKVARLDRTEWQRWVPFLGLARLIHGGFNGNQRLWDDMHSTSYKVLNILYNMVPVIATPLAIGLNNQ